MDFKKCGEFLQALRKAKGLKQSDVAEFFDVSNKTVSKWECGESLPEVPLLKALAEYYGVTVDEILAGERAKKEEDPSKAAGSNENYFYTRYQQRLSLWVTIAFLVLLLGFFTLIVLGYATRKSGLASFTGLGITFAAVCVFAIGLTLSSRLSSDFTEEHQKALKKKKILFFMFFISGTLFSLYAEIIFRAIPVELGVPAGTVVSIETFLTLLLYALACIAIADTFIYLFLWKRETVLNQKYMKYLFMAVLFADVLVLLFVPEFQGYRKTVDAYSCAFYYVFTDYFFGIILQVVPFGLALLAFVILSLCKKNTLIAEIIMYILLMVDAVFFDVSGGMGNGQVITFDIHVILFYVFTSVLLLYRIGLFIYMRSKDKKGKEEASDSEKE